MDRLLSDLPDDKREELSNGIIDTETRAINKGFVNYSGFPKIFKRGKYE